MADEQDLIWNHLDLRKMLEQIGIDFGGGMPSAAYEKEEVPDQPKGMPSDKPEPVITENNIRELWKTADETVDWTDALAHDKPSDGLTGKNLWSFYHGIAEKVLSGDHEAYTEVLKTSNPLKDLVCYADGISIQILSADRLRSTFICKDELMNENRKLYLAGMGLRIARDLLACLPVKEVEVTAEQEGKTVFSATYQRQQLLHRSFAFINPIMLADEIGAKFE